jgi:hypothetical protein
MAGGIEREPQDEELKDLGADVAAAVAAEVAAEEAVAEPVHPQEVEELREETREVQDYMGIGKADDPALEEAAKRLAEAAGGTEA